MKILRKLLTVILLTGLLCLLSSCGWEQRRIEKYFQEEIGQMLELDLTDCSMVEYWNNQGWMGDGNYLVTFALSERAITQLYTFIESQNSSYKDNESKIWYALPFSDMLYEEIYSGRSPFEDFRENAPSKNALPYVENGYWWSDVYSAGFDGSYSGSDFGFSIFDADMGRLYYYEHHM